MKKLLIIPLIAIMLCGCNSQDNEYSDKVSVKDIFYTYTDEETCVEYFVSYGSYNMGNITPKYNQDGALKLNKKCLRDKMEEK